tara:strand:- start:397 stop:588 length:192 start_codon:yes stop_codon:yes gene_type:complete
VPRLIKFKADAAINGAAYEKGAVVAISVNEAAEAVDKGVAEYADGKKAAAKNRAMPAAEIAER